MRSIYTKDYKKKRSSSKMAGSVNLDNINKKNYY